MRAQTLGRSPICVVGRDGIPLEMGEARMQRKQRALGRVSVLTLAIATMLAIASTASASGARRPTAAKRSCVSTAHKRSHSAHLHRSHHKAVRCAGRRRKRSVKVPVSLNPFAPTVAQTSPIATAAKRKPPHGQPQPEPTSPEPTSPEPQPGTTLPTAPAGLSAAPGDQRVALSWAASSSSLGVAGYRVYRNGGQVAQATSNSFTDSGLTDGSTYSYYVVAYDTAGGVSSASNTVSATPFSSSVGGSAGPSYYVSTAGNDANAGTQASPWRTIAHAATAAVAGSTVLIEAGSYAEDVKLQVSGAAGSPVSFKANGGEAVNVRSFNVAASHVVIQNLTISGASGHCVTIQPALTDVTIRANQIRSCGADGIHFARPGNPPSSNYTTGSLIAANTISGVGVSNRAANDMTLYANYLTVLGNEMTGSPNDAIDLWGDHITVRGNDIHDISNAVGNHNDAFQSWTGLADGAEGNPVTNLLVEQNRVVNVLGSNAHGFMLEGPGHRNWVVRDNVFANIGSIGMILGINGSGIGSQSLSVYNNTFFNAGPNDAVEFNALDTGVFVNNIVQGGGGLYVAAGAAVTENYNLLSATSINIGAGANDVKAAPGFVNAAAGDFHLVSGSPAVNSGDNGTIVSPVRPADLDGNPVVGIVDRGAYEFQG
jgi:chitodextrinase